MSERRYSDDDVHRILARAAEVETALQPGDGDERAWTLAQIQQVGAEAGLSPVAIAAAAATLDRAGDAAGGRHFGLPTSVVHAVPLERRFDDDDWERLVSQLRDTFEARGRERVAGERREWWNGNLRVTVEPAADGALLHFRTRKGDARPLLNLGAAMTALSAALGGLVAFGGDDKALAAAAVSGALGVATLVGGALRLPGWARLRARQFDALGRFARRLGAGG